MEPPLYASAARPDCFLHALELLREGARLLRDAGGGERRGGGHEAARRLGQQKG